MTVAPGAVTDPGLQRTINEDRVYLDCDRGVFLVVDGLGGHAAGEMAAQLAVDVIARDLGSDDGDTEVRVRRAITAANNEIVRVAQDNPELEGMGCVLTLAVVRDGTVTVGHVGDSRLYLIWNGSVRKVTSDHSPVGEQEDLGEMTESQAMTHPRRNEVFRDLGSRRHAPDDEDFIEVRSFPYQPCAALLLCTDGLSDALSSSEICEIVDEYDGDADEIARKLVAAAKQRDGADNISVIFIPGPDFLGVRSLTAADARARHAITRRRSKRDAWIRRTRRALLLVVGMVLGVVLWQAVEKLLGGLL